MRSTLRYRDFESERPPAPRPGETQHERLRRVLRSMPAAADRDPKLMVKFLKKAFPPMQNEPPA